MSYCYHILVAQLSIREGTCQELPPRIWLTCLRVSPHYILLIFIATSAKDIREQKINRGFKNIHGLRRICRVKSLSLFSGSRQTELFPLAQYIFMQLVFTVLISWNPIVPVGIWPVSCRFLMYFLTKALCLEQTTPTMYSSFSAITDITSDGG